MPAKDTLHDTVIVALEKDDWIVTAEQFSLYIGKRRLWIDLRVEKLDEIRVILVEVKGHINASPILYLESLIGQYTLYRVVLNQQKINTPLYVAIPSTVYNSILKEEIGQEAIEQLDLKLIVFDAEREDIILWRH